MSAANDFLSNLQKVLIDNQNKLYTFHEKYFNDYHELLNNINKRSTAKKLIAIEEGTDYAKDVFFAIHCIQANESECEIETEFGSMVYPPYSFVQGAIYPINALRIKSTGGGKFIGLVS
jgi:hypothetical protein